EEEAQPSPHRPRPTPLRRAVRDAPRRRVLHGSEHPWGAHHDRRLTPHTHPRAGSKTHPASRSLTILPRHHDPQQEPSLLLTKNIGTPPPPDQRRLVRWGRCVHCSVHASHVPGPFRRVSAAPARHRSTSPTARAVGPPSNPLRTVSSNQLKAMPAPAATSRNRMVVREFISEEDALERAVDRRGGDPDDDASGELMLGQPGVESRV